MRYASLNELKSEGRRASLVTYASATSGSVSIGKHLTAKGAMGASATSGSVSIGKQLNAKGAIGAGTMGGSVSIGNICRLRFSGAMRALCCVILSEPFVECP